MGGVKAREGITYRNYINTNQQQVTILLNRKIREGRKVFRNDKKVKNQLSFWIELKKTTLKWKKSKMKFQGFQILEKNR